MRGSSLALFQSCIMMACHMNSLGVSTVLRDLQRLSGTLRLKTEEGVLGAGRDGGEGGENYPDAEISDCYQNLSESALCQGQQVAERRGGVCRRMQFRYLLCLAARRLGIKL